MLFKDLSLGTSFFGVLPIVLPFWKALVSPILLVPRYGLKTQRLIRGNPHKRAKKNFVTFLGQFWFFFPIMAKWAPRWMHWAPEEKPMGKPLEHWKFCKNAFFSESNPQFFFSFLPCRSKNLKFLLSKQHSILKFFQIFETKNLKNLRIEHCLENKNFKFFDLQVRNEKKIGGYFLKTSTWRLEVAKQRMLEKRLNT